MSPWARRAGESWQEPRETILLCRIRRCTAPARWILTIAGHPNGDPVPSAYCHEHASERSKLLWDESPRPYKLQAEGPYTPRELRIALGPDATAEHVTSKREQIADLEPAPLTSLSPEPAVGSIVRDPMGARWIREFEAGAGWRMLAQPAGDVESWTKVAGNYGPVTLDVGERGA